LTLIPPFVSARVYLTLRSYKVATEVACGALVRLHGRSKLGEQLHDPMERDLILINPAPERNRAFPPTPPSHRLPPRPSASSEPSAFAFASKPDPLNHLPHPQNYFPQKQPKTRVSSPHRPWKPTKPLYSLAFHRSRKLRTTPAQLDKLVVEIKKPATKFRLYPSGPREDLIGAS
jgi:hypothetical protein